VRKQQNSMAQLPAKSSKIWYTESMARNFFSCDALIFLFLASKLRVEMYKSQIDIHKGTQCYTKILNLHHGIERGAPKRARQSVSLRSGEWGNKVMIHTKISF